MQLFLCCVALSLTGVLCQTTVKPTTVRHTPRPGPQLGAVLNQYGHFGRILGILNQTGLTNQLLQEPAITLFLPTNEALAKMPSDYIDSLMADPQRLEEILSYHVVTKAYNRIYNDEEFMSMSNKPIRVNQYSLGNTRITAVEGVKMTTGALHVRNGYVYGIDGFMVPPEGDIMDIIVRRGDMKTFANLITKANLGDYIKNDHNITVFAPTDAAFAKLDSSVMTYLDYNPSTVKEILLFHIINRESLYSIGMRHTMIFEAANAHRDHLMVLEKGADININHAKVLEKDISANNGVMYVIDDVLVPIRVIMEIESMGLTVG